MWALPQTANPVGANLLCTAQLLLLFCSPPHPSSSPASGRYSSHYSPLVPVPIKFSTCVWNLFCRPLAVRVCFLQEYHQECDMFGLVAKMLIEKDPSLEVPIQSSLQKNLRDIGKRCVDAMQKFIEDYDSRQCANWPRRVPLFLHGRGLSRLQARCNGTQWNAEKASNRSSLLSRCLNC